MEDIESPARRGPYSLQRIIRDSLGATTIVVDEGNGHHTLRVYSELDEAPLVRLGVLVRGCGWELTYRRSHMSGWHLAIEPKEVV